MITVPEAARRARRHPETIRRWIREGRLRATKVGTQHTIEERDLDALLDSDEQMLSLPEEWRLTSWGAAMPNVVRMVRRSRQAH